MASRTDKEFSDAELAAEYYRAITHFQSACVLHDIFGDSISQVEMDVTKERMFIWETHAELPSIWEERDSNGI